MRPLYPFLACFAIILASWTLVSAGAWWIEVVDNQGEVGKYSSIALDSKGRPHIAYFDGSKNSLKYAWWDGSGWKIEIVDESENLELVGIDVSLALDSRDLPHLTYFVSPGPLQEGSPGLRYARLTPRGWEIQAVDNGNLGSYSSLVLDPRGNPHVSYYAHTPHRDLRYAELGDGGWTIETVDWVGDVGMFSSLALDENGEPHISYYSWTEGDLKYARRSGGEWTIEVVDKVGDVGMFSKLVLTPDGTPHICYYDLTRDRLKHAYKSKGWIVEEVDNQGVGRYLDVALDPQGNLHVSYYDWSRGELKYARLGTRGWVIDVVDNLGDVGQHTSIAVDENLKPHISYFDFTNGDLKYALGVMALKHEENGVKLVLLAFVGAGVLILAVVLARKVFLVGG